MSEEDIVKRLLAACVGWPNTTISWPHRLLHDAREEIERLRLKALTPAVEPVVDGELESVINFLLGEAELAGLWFGENDGRAPFWWRKYLRAAMKTTPPETKSEE